MGITDELRKWWVSKFPVMDSGLYKDFTAITNSIDKAHEEALSRLYMDMSDSEWVRLPKDADGVPIRVGDVLDECAVNTYVFLPAKVVGYHECCGEIMPIVENDGEFQVKPDCVCHHHAPTVEDVLREFYVYAERGAERHREDVDDAVLAEYAAKLQLRGDGE